MQEQSPSNFLKDLYPGIVPDGFYAIRITNELNSLFNAALIVNQQHRYQKNPMTTPNPCPSCGNQSFEITSAKPVDLKYQILLVQCASCKHVIGTLSNEETEKIMQVLANNMHRQQ